MKRVILLLLFSLLLSLSHQDQTIKGKVVEIQPVALDVILPIYDRVVVYFTNGIKSQNTQLYEKSVQEILTNFDQEMVNKTLFGICDLSKDLSGKLRKFGGRASVQLITAITHYQLTLPIDHNEAQSFFKQVPNFIKAHTSSKAEQVDWQQVKSKYPYNKGYLLIITPSTQAEHLKSNIIYKKIFDYLNFFNTKLVINKNYGKQLSVDLYLDGNFEFNYPGSAVQVLFNFTTQPSKQQIYDLIQFINVETIDDVTYLNEENYFRIFGVQHQILMVFREKDANNQQIKSIIKQYQKAAFHNKKDGLKYQRILFAVAHAQFLTDYFADQVLQSEDQLYTIILTHSDYSSFQLRKFVYQQKQVTSDKLIQFIKDVRMKKIDAKYKSQQIQDNKGKKIRKIVGKNFQKEIFQQPQKSVMVLFIDSKDPSSSQNIINAVQAFVQKYYEAYKDHLHVGIFDLSKNQHKLLTISSAPELVLFERTNKKKPKFFKGDISKQSIKNFVNYEVKDVTIPQNFGQPPIALGGSSEL